MCIALLCLPAHLTPLVKHRRPGFQVLALRSPEGEVAQQQFSQVESGVQRANLYLGVRQALQEAAWAGPGRCMALTWHRPLFCYRSILVGQRPTGDRVDLKSLLVVRDGARSSPLAIEQALLMHGSEPWGHATTDMALGLLAWTCVC